MAQCNYFPTPKVRGLFGFSADPGRRHDSLYPPYFLNQWGEFYRNCMDTSLGQAKELIKFCDFDPMEVLDCYIFCVGVGVTDSCMHDIS